MPPTDRVSFFADFTSANGIIDKFVQTLHVVMRDQKAIVTCTLAHAATIQLNKIFSQGDERSRQKCLDAAQTVINIVVGVGNGGGAHLDPIMGVSVYFAFLNACHELLTLSNRRPSGPRLARSS
jgi:hypothetical protein